jgi:hypothetical protein
MNDAAMKRVFEELETIKKNMMTKEDLDALLDTLEIMKNPRTLKQIQQSREDIRKGRLKEFSVV